MENKSAQSGGLGTAAGQNILRAYYLATPAFFLADRLWNFDIRIPFLDLVPAVKYAYYGVLFSCGLVTLKYPKSASYIGLAESTSSLLAVLASFWIVLYQVVPYGIMNSDTFCNPITLQSVSSMALNGGIFTLSIYSNPLFKKWKI